MSEVRFLLGDALDALIDHRGKTPKKLGGDWSLTGHRVVSAINIKASRVDSNDHHYVSDSLYLKWMKEPLRAGDVLLTSEAPTGEVAYLESDEDWCLGQRLFGLRGKRGLLDGRYLFYMLRGGDVRHQLMSRATGTTVLGIRQSELVKIEVTLPAIAEQRGVAATLGALDGKIESIRRQIAIANALADELWEIIAVAATTSVYVDELTAAGTLQLSDGYRTRVDQLGEPGVPVLRVADVADDHFAVRPDADHVRDTYRSKYREKVSVAGDVLVTTKGTVGRTALVGPDDVSAVYSPQLCFVRTLDREKLPPAALHRWVRSHYFRSQAQQVQHQTDMAAYVSLADFRRFRLPLVDPYAKELADIEALDLLIAASRQEATALGSMRDVLLPELLSGRIRVPEGREVAKSAL